jgi:hypothetical protein
VPGKLTEGLRLLPYYQEASAHGAHAGRTSCTPCRQQLDVTSRQDIGCVFEAPAKAGQIPYALRFRSGAPSIPWRDVEGKPVAPTTCPLYLGRLAERSDILDAVPHFRRGIGNLRAWLGREPEPSLLEALEAHEAGVNDWVHDPKRPKEGA